MNKQELGNQDKKEKARELTVDEKKRLKDFEELADRMVQQGYRRVELTVSIIKANWFAILLLIPLFVVGGGLFYLKNRGLGDERFRLLCMN